MTSLQGAMTRLSAGFLLAVCCAGAAAAQTPAEAARRWGLLGRWMFDCNAPMGRFNAFLDYVVRDGRLYHDRTAGNITEKYLVPVARLSADGGLEMTIEFGGAIGTRTMELRLPDDKHYLVWSNREAGTEQYSIKDGKFVNGTNTPPLITRCGPVP